MASLNKVLLIGRLGKDPEVRYMTNGEAVANFSLATSEKWKDKSGEQQEKTEWHNCVAYRKLAEIIGEYVKKGGLLYVEGRIHTRKWQDKEGKDRYTTEIVVNEMQMLGGKPAEQHESEPATRPAPSSTLATPAAKGNFDNFDDDIPF